MLAVSRFLLGLGEGGGFPAATRAVAEWFPAHERSTAMGIVNAGTAVGGVVSAPLIALVLHWFGWPAVFLITGALGLIWTAWWRRAYFVPMRHPRLGEAERRLLSSVMSHDDDPRTPGWVGLLRIRQTWGLVIAKFLSDAAWYFYLFWLPKYLYDARGFDIKAVGSVRVDPLCGGRRRLPRRRVAIELVADPTRLARPRPESRAWCERRRDAARPVHPERAGRLGAGPLQRRVLRTAVVVDAGDDSAS